MYTFDELAMTSTKDDLNKFIANRFNIPPAGGLKQAVNSLYGSKLVGEEKNEEPKIEEKWIWIEGYKGTNKYMTCRDFKFDFHTVFSIPEGEEVRECDKGFHLCFELNDVFGYYRVGDGNRFFKVKALVRESDYKRKMDYKHSPSRMWRMDDSDKIVAKSIEFISECSAEEVLTAKGIDCSEWTLEEQWEALKNTPGKIQKKKQVDKLVELGYSQTFAHYVVHHINSYQAAVAAASQPGLSMDMKCLMILMDND